MLAQLAWQQHSSSPSASKSATSCSSSSAPSGGNLFLGGIGGKDDATAVSDGWVVGTPTPAHALCDSSGGGDGDGGRLASSLASSGHLSGTTSSASLPQACSSLSFADLGDLCGDQEGADDACGGVFLVGGDDCEDVNGSGIGLDLYDLGQVHTAVDIYLPILNECYRVFATVLPVQYELVLVLGSSRAEGGRKEGQARPLVDVFCFCKNIGPQAHKLRILYRFVLRGARHQR